MKLNEKFVLFSCVKLVKGASRSIICDLQRTRFHFVPNFLCEILTIHNQKTINEIYLFYNYEYDETIFKYFEFLFFNEYIYFTKDIERFPEISEEILELGQIDNAIIDIKLNTSNINKFILEVVEHGCRFIQIRIFEKKSLLFIYRLLALFDDSSIHNIELLTPYSESLCQELLEKLSSRFIRVRSIIFHSSNTSLANHKTFNSGANIVYTERKIDSSLHCGEIQLDHFSINMSLFNESLKYNNCLGKKISLDIDGNIKNCPSMNFHYGNIENTSLRDVFVNKKFKTLTKIKKDQIQTCSVCEFRYICTDCRAYIEDSNDLLSKPLKCGYNPFTGIWS